MVAKVVGIVAGVAVFFIYFTVVGTHPVLETLLGVGLALVAGGGAWWLVDSRMSPGGGDRGDV